MTESNPQASSENVRESSISSPRSSTDSRSPPSRSHSFRLNHLSSSQQHRQSFTESLRSGPPPSRARRQPSLNQSAIQSLIDHPPSRNASNPAFEGRDWREISIGELVSPEDLRFVEIDTGIEDATNLLIESGAGVLLIRESPTSTSAVGTFDYSDLNAYLLLVVGLAQPEEEEQITSFRELAQKAREGNKIPLKDVKDMGREEPLVTLPPSANLTSAIETFGGGVHRIVVVKENSSDVIGILSQSRLVKFLWENGRSFPVIDQLYPQYLKDLRIGSHSVMSINGDKPLFHALELMNNQGISSVAVVDNHNNVVGNISVVDVKLLTKSSSLPLLDNTCIHFISVILSTRGMNEGKDSFPVFHVNPLSTLAHTVAKLVATASHRMWVTDPQSPSSSNPPTPSNHSAMHIPLPVSTGNHVANQASSPTTSPPVPSPGVVPVLGERQSPQPPNYTQPHHPAPIYQPASPGAAGGTSSSSLPSPISTSIPASSLPGARLSGRLVGVVSLTDILNLYARASGLSPADPNETRNRRRRSSSSSVGMGPRRSGDVGRDILGRR